MIQVNWSQFKELLDKGAVRARYVSTPNGYAIYGCDQALVFQCAVVTGEADCTEFENSYQAAIDSVRAASVATQFEREDIRLQMSRAEAAFASGAAEVSIKLPGTVGTEPVFIGGGYAFTDVHTFGDCVEKVQIVDIDDILGFGAHTVVATYHDDRVAAGNQGWYLYPAPQAGGEIEVDPMGFYGEAVAGLYLELYFKCSAATKVYVDFIFGRLTS